MEFVSLSVEKTFLVNQAGRNRSVSHNTNFNVGTNGGSGNLNATNANIALNSTQGSANISFGRGAGSVSGGQLDSTTLTLNGALQSNISVGADSGFGGTVTFQSPTGSIPIEVHPV